MLYVILILESESGPTGKFRDLSVLSSRVSWAGFFSGPKGP
jgi:hypothetical protein